MKLKVHRAFKRRAESWRHLLRIKGRNLVTNMNNDVDLNSTTARILRWLLVIIGCGLLCATFAIFLPVSWMAKTHEWLGLGEFPDVAITAYLARSTSMLYAAHGALMLIASFDLKRYWPLVPVFGWLHVIMGLTILESI